MRRPAGSRRRSDRTPCRCSRARGAIEAGVITRGDAPNRRTRETARSSAGRGRKRCASDRFDPQSRGGLLIAVAAKDADGLVRALRDGGDEPATVVGEIVAGGAGIEFV